MRRASAIGFSVSMLLALCAAAVVACTSCRRHIGTYDVSVLQITRYRYVIMPGDELVHVAAEVYNAGGEMVEAAVVTITGIGRNGEKRGESRVRVERLGAGEKRVVLASFKNRGRVATVEVGIEAVPEEERLR